jgi:hypothetical protein|tara:strand:+ start:35 stop:334 length:300 start_codon:yes stop_codon:yes gene_type:complete
MIIKNNSEAFDILFNGDEHHIPAGQFEVTEALGLHIKQKSMEWERDIEIINAEQDKQIITQVTPVQEPEKEELKKEEPKEDVKEIEDEKTTDKESTPTK